MQEVATVKRYLIVRTIVETALVSAQPLLALALFDDASKTNDVMPRLQRFGPWAVEAFKICKMGAHERVEGDLKTLIDSSQRLSRQLVELK